MSIQNEMPGYNEMNQYLNQQGTGLTPAEMHGLISGMICGGNDDSSWLPLLHDLTNEGMAFGHELAQAAFSIGLMRWLVGSITSCLVLALRNRSWTK